MRSSHLVTFSIQESCNSQFVLCDIERIVQISDVIRRVQTIIVNEVRPVGVDKCIESESITPACREIFNLNTFVPVVTNASMLRTANKRLRISHLFSLLLTVQSAKSALGVIRRRINVVTRRPLSSYCKIPHNFPDSLQHFPTCHAYNDHNSSTMPRNSRQKYITS